MTQDKIREKMRGFLKFKDIKNLTNADLWKAVRVKLRRNS